MTMGSECCPIPPPFALPLPSRSKPVQYRGTWITCLCLLSPALSCRISSNRRGPTVCSFLRLTLHKGGIFQRQSIFHRPLREDGLDEAQTLLTEFPPTAILMGSALSPCPTTSCFALPPRPVSLHRLAELMPPPPMGPGLVSPEARARGHGLLPCCPVPGAVQCLS